MPAPSAADTRAYGEGSQAFGDLLDWGYNFGYFGILEAAAGEVLSDDAVTNLINNYRCHARFGGLSLGTNHSNSNAVSSAAKTMRTSARGPWLLPFATAPSAAGEELTHEILSSLDFLTRQFIINWNTSKIDPPWIAILTEASFCCVSA